MILDEDGLYDPTTFNDRLLLGLKGNLSEVELHYLATRLRGGILNKAKRGELRVKLPIGLCYDDAGNVILDPDRQVQDTVTLFFETFFRLGAATAAVRHFRHNKLLFPRRINGGLRQGELLWGSLGVTRAVGILHNPRFAGAYAYGRLRSRKLPNGKMQVERQPRDQWISLIKDAHSGYITWNQYEEIEATLEKTAKAYGADRRHGPPREGPALLQGRAICGCCGHRMTVRYHHRKKGLVPQYACINRGPTVSESPCQIIPGEVVDQAIGQLVIEAVEPSALQIAVAVQEEVGQRLKEADRQRMGHVERAQYQVEAARQRYMKVDPSNRLVADTLEADWNEKLRTLEQARLVYEKQREADELLMDQETKERVANLAHEFPAIWNDPKTPSKERKRMLALLIEDVTLIKQNQITAHVRYRGGAIKTLDFPIPLNAWQRRQTHPEVVKLIDQLLEQHTDAETAEILNERGCVSGAGDRFSSERVAWVRYNHNLKSLRQRLRDRGMLTTQEICDRFGIAPCTVSDWRRRGRLKGRPCNGNRYWMYEPPILPLAPDEQAPTEGYATTS